MKPKIIVLDDDPTGSQTVHSCLLLTVWDIDTLRLGLTDESPIFFILTNTRSLPPEQAAQVTREVCQNLKSAIASLNIQDYLIVSRSDSTLRGHYPIETDVIAEELGGVDAHFLVPAFFEGGRITLDSVHYLIVDNVPIPVHETEFARDSVFSYSYSYLPDYVAEKTQGRIPGKVISWQTIIGYLLALGAAAMLALYALWFNTLNKQGIAPKAFNVVFVTCLLGGFLSLLYTIFFPTPSVEIRIDRQVILVLVGLGILATALPSLCYTVAAQRLPVVVTTAILLLEPVFAVLFASVALQEFPSLWFGIGSLLVFWGLLSIAKGAN